MDTGDIARTDGVHADSAFLPQGVFTAPAVSK